MNRAKRSSGFETIGVIGVDAGLCWVGDPCYCVTPDAGNHPAVSWAAFCERLDQSGHDQQGFTAFPYALGHEGLGIAVSTGYGDGEYPVQIRRNAEGRIAELRVLFIE